MHPSLRHALFCLIAVFGCDLPAAEKQPLELRMYSGVEASLFPNSVLILGGKEAVLVDGQWWLSEGEKVARMIADSGRRLTAVLITHAHPDHYMGLQPVLARFPEARVLARRAIRDEIRFSFQSKRRHWQELVPDDMPLEPPPVEEFSGAAIELEGHEIRFVDLPPSETLVATAFYVPSARALITGDLVFAGSHSYLADVDNPASWIDALSYARSAGPIETVYPGHGPVGGLEQIDDAIAYMKVYAEVARPGVRVADMAREMTRRYPQHRGAILLWLTRGPGFALSGAREFGVPQELMPPPPAATPAKSQ
jgi:glyoxylase-like metal-dependent hydrolase (beta-lactamase superfamily II)